MIDINMGNQVKRRGRPKNTTTLSDMNSRKKYNKLLERKISRQDVYNYIAVVMSMGIRKYTSLSSYFKYNGIHLGLFLSLFKSRL